MTHPAFDPDRFPRDRFDDDPPDPALEDALQALAPVRPSRDLWPEIAARLDAPRLTVAPGPPRPPSPAPSVRALPPRRRWLAAAAVALMAASSGGTYLVMRADAVPQTAGPSAPPAPVLLHTVLPNTGGTPNGPPTAPRVAQADEGPTAPSANSSASAPNTPPPTNRRRADVTRAVAVRAGGAVDTAVPGAAEYDREIADLRGVVADRHSELDSATVAVLARNLQIIDAAIAASRAALARDPHSPFLGEQLTRALGQKVDLLRTAALLPRT